MKKLSLAFSITLCLLFSCAVSPTPQSQTKRDDIIKLLDLTDTKGKISETLDIILKYMQENGHGIPPKFYEKLKAEIKLESITEIYITMYDKHFSHDDIKDLIKFYESSIGKKVVEARPLMGKDVHGISIKLVEKINEAKDFSFKDEIINNIASLASQNQAKRNDIIKLLDLTDGKLIASEMLGITLEYLQKYERYIPPKFYEEFKAEITLENFIEMSIAMYDKHFSHDDIKGLIKFYESSIGKKKVKTESLMDKDSYRIFEELNEKIESYIHENIDKIGDFSP